AGASELPQTCREVNPPCKFHTLPFSMWQKSKSGFEPTLLLRKLGGSRHGGLRICPILLCGSSEAPATGAPQ
ncbi:MAG: hypothetical protein K2H96_08575, partial [Muribaculaceae bacterium]|nr:hypothetical protein [Muribaculaceae bacterium]